MTLRLPQGLIDLGDSPDPTLTDLLPSVLAPLGVPGLRASAALAFPPVERTVVLMVDGLGLQLPWVTDAPSLASAPRTLIAAGFPTSTSVSITSIATGVRPGEHGIVGYTMAIPEADVVLECLSWRSYDRDRRDLATVAVPELIQPVPPLASRARAAGVEVTVVSYAPHAGSALTRAALRGSRYVPIPWEEDEAARLAAITGVLDQPGPQVVYTYFAGVDQAGHEHGIRSHQWAEQVRRVDALVARMVDALPPGSRLIVTADHGMVDVEREARIDLAEQPELARGVRRFAGDPRMRHLHVDEGETERVAERWRAELGWTVCLLTRDEAIDGGLFGPVVRPEVRGRIGDLLALAVGPVAIFDSRVAPGEVALTGHHGSLTGAELFVPALEFVR